VTLSQVKTIEVDLDDFSALLDRAKTSLSEKDYELLKNLVDAYVYVGHLVEDKQTTIRHLRRAFLGSSSEKARDVTQGVGSQPDGTSSTTQNGSDDGESKDDTAASQKRKKGHGRHGANAYTGGQKVTVSHDSLHHGDPCPSCQQGKIYTLEPGVIIRFRGQAPLGVTRYELEKLRCNLCGTIFTAKPPQNVGDQKYDATSASMIAMFKYGSGVPFNRLAQLQGSLGIPLPASTQWQIVHRCGTQLARIYDQLIQEAAAGQVLHNDDTPMKILELIKERKEHEAQSGSPPKRKGVFTSGVVSVHDDHKIVLFFTGPQHAGENLGDVLKHRSAELHPPIQMCDALSRNVSAEYESIVANCLTHGRRKFVDEIDVFPDECVYVINTLGEVYQNDAVVLKRGLSPEERLAFHQSESEPLMKSLHQWFDDQFTLKRVEPNSSLGQAIQYMIKHWDKLTLFLRVAGAPLDNNVCERALKKAILHRKNAMFFKTRHGARIGDIFMSLIYTAQLCDANPLDYLTKLQIHHKAVAGDPGAWLP